MKAGGRMLAAALVVAGLFAPASANAAVSATITGDDGQPVPMTVGAPPTLRNMNISVAPALAQGDAVSWRYVVTDATGTAITSDLCWSSPTPKDRQRAVPRQHDVRPHGDAVQRRQLRGGAEGRSHRVHLERRGERRDRSARRPAADASPQARSTANIHLLDFAGNPGTSTYEIQYAKGGVIGPDGAISGPSTSTYLDRLGQGPPSGLRRPRPVRGRRARLSAAATPRRGARR